VQENLTFAKRSLELAFNAFEKDRIGKIAVSEVKRIFGCGLLKGDETFEEVVKEVEEYQHSEIDINELRRMIEKLYSV
jgi:Ca2+-binding EF-hand superfamily protein